MPRYPGATWRDIHVSRGDRSNGSMRSYKGLILHVNQSNGNLFNYVNNPANQVSCHFEVYKSGLIEQYIDTSMSSWCQTDGNNDWISGESEGYPNEPLNDAQLKAFAGLYAWIHEVHPSIPLAVTDNPAINGLAYHGLGAKFGLDWGHALCPGTPRQNQRAAIIQLAKPQPPKPPIQGDDMPKNYLAHTTGNRYFVVAADLSSKTALVGSPGAGPVLAAMTDQYIDLGTKLTDAQLAAIPDVTVVAPPAPATP